MSTHAPLGRGLSALLNVEPTSIKTDPRDGEVRFVSINDVSPGPYQPRQHFHPEQLNDLAQSILKQGILQPLIVRPLENQVTSYEIVAGERRWQAAQKAGLSHVPVLVKKLNDRQTLEVAITENVQRADLNPIEEAEGYKRLIEDFDYTQEDVSSCVGKSRSHIANTIRLLSLPDKVRGYLEEGALSPGHARALITMENPEALAREIIEKKLSVRDAESLTQAKKRGIQTKQAPQEDIVYLEENIQSALGLKAQINLKGAGGEIKISFKSLEELDAFVGRICR